MTGNDIGKALLSLVEAFSRRDLDAVMSHFAEDAVLEMPRGPDPWGRRFVGKAEVREGLPGRFKGMSDVHYAAPRVTSPATPASRAGRITGTAPGGAKIRANGCDFYTFRDGLVVKKDSYWKIVEG
jgi:ketosteroid isomerase-like protein